MADGLTLRQATPADIPAIVSFVDSVLTETQAQKATLLDDSFYRWQYDVARDIIVVAESDGEILAHYPLVVYPMRCGERTVMVGVCQDLSVSDRLRGQGVFRQMGNVANELAVARGLDLLFAFPNHRSISGFTKHHGYRVVGTLGWRVAIIDPLQAVPIDAVRRAGRALFPGRPPSDPPTAGPWNVGHLGDDALPADRLGCLRTTEYLDWRFARRPHTAYRGFVEHEGGKPVAWAAVRVQELKGLRCGLIMDLAAVPGAERQLDQVLCRCRAYFRAEGVALAFLIASPGFSATGALKRAGYMAIPDRFAPRQLNLVARALQPDLEPLVQDPARWQLTFADWDVF